MDRSRGPGRAGLENGRVRIKAFRLWLLCGLLMIPLSLVEGGEDRPTTPNPPTARPPARTVHSSLESSVPADIRRMTNPRYLTQLAQVHLAFGADERAKPLLLKALKTAKDPGQKSTIHKTLGALLRRAKDWEGAARQYEAARAIEPRAREQRRLGLTLAEAYAKAKQPEKAEKLLRELSKPGGKEAPDAGEEWLRRDAQRRLLQIWQRQPGRLEQATAEAKAELDKHPEDIGALDRLVEIYLSAKHDNKKALPYLEKWQALKPDDRNVRNKLALLYRQTKQFDKAIALYRQAMASASKEESKSLAFQAAQLMLMAGKKTEAIGWAKKHFAPKDATSRDLAILAGFEQQAGMHEMAGKAFVQAAKLAKHPSEKAGLLLRAADSARRRKDYTGAERQIRAILKEFKNNKNVRARAKRDLVRLYEEQGKLDELKLGE